MKNCIDNSANVNLKNITSNAPTNLNNVGARTVVESYQNGSNWYRIWSDGWIEQGGVSTHAFDENYTVNLLKTMSNTNYTVLVTVSPLSSPYTAQVGVNRLTAFNLSTSSFDLRGDTSTTMQRHSWYVCGF